jgi:hypothetical protein
MEPTHGICKLAQRVYCHVFYYIQTFWHRTAHYRAESSTAANVVATDCSL